VRSGLPRRSGLCKTVLITHYTPKVAERVAAIEPAQYTTSAALPDRPGRLFADYLRNGRGTTAVRGVLATSATRISHRGPGDLARRGARGST
jgi:DNA primase